MLDRLESENAPRAVETIFGWTLAGEITKEPEYRSLVTVNFATEKYTMESDLKDYGIWKHWER